MNYIVMDLEFNQAYDFTHGNATVTDPTCPFEIIQIGAVKLDNNFSIIDHLSILIKPAIYKRMHPYVESITGISMDMLDIGVDLPFAVKKFAEFIGNENYSFCVWGSFDMKTLFHNMDYHHIDRALLSENYINVQESTALYLKKPKKTCIGLKNAASLLDIACDLPFHNALNDAFYTAHILRTLKLDIKTYQH